jgi:hypothetical protein
VIHGAESAVSRTAIPQDQKGGGFMGKAFPDIGAGGFLAHGMKLAPLDHGTDFFETGA